LKNENKNIRLMDNGFYDDLRACFWSFSAMHRLKKAKILNEKEMGMVSSFADK